MWKRPSRSTVPFSLPRYASRTAWLNWPGSCGAPVVQMAGSFAGAVPGSRPFQVMPSRTTLNPSLAISDASAAPKFHGLPGAG